jgi:hypothetical protein
MSGSRRSRRRGMHPTGGLLQTHECGLCGLVLVDGEVCRLLVDSFGWSTYGHAACIDGLVAERVKLGDRYLGDRPAGP